MSAGEDEWNAILSPDEEILWQGRLEKGLALDVKNAKEFLPGALSVGFAIVWMHATRDGATEMQAIGLLLFLAGGHQLFFTPFFRGYLPRACTFYTLTDKRAFVAVDHPLTGRSLKPYKIGPETSLDFQLAPYACIYFASELEQGHESTTAHRIGFANLKDGEAVFGIMGQVQQGRAS
jgi:hypothetical protein